MIYSGHDFTKSQRLAAYLQPLPPFLVSAFPRRAQTMPRLQIAAVEQTAGAVRRSPAHGGGAR